MPADIAFRIINHHHSPVVQISYTLPVLFTFLQDMDVHHLAGQHHRFDRIGQLIHIQDGNPLKFSHLVQVEIVGQYLAFERFA